MPTLNDILTANGDYTPVSGYPVDDKYEDDSPVINVYDRTIGEIIGDTSTSGENVSQYLTFRIPRHPDHYDLIENGTNIRILYRLEDDTGEDVVPVNVVANEDYIIFGWKIPLVVTVNPGVVTFIIHAYKSENNLITYHYKTLPKTYTILETMETDVVVPEIEMYNLAEAYARGTVTDVFGQTRPVEEGEPGYHDNSKYYKELAGTSKTDAETAKNAAEAAQEAAEEARQAAEDARDQAVAIVGGEYVSYGQTQSLNDTQKAKARENIEATGPNGYYPNMTVGLSENFVGTGEPTRRVFDYDTAGGSADISDGNAEIEKMYGDTVVWNQLAKEFITGNWTEQANIRYENGVMTITAESLYDGASQNGGTIQVYASHKYYACADVMADTEEFVLTLSYTYKNCLSTKNTNGAFERVAKIFSPPSDGLARWKLQDNRSSGWTEVKIKNLHIIDLTQMFGAGNEPATVEEFKAMFPLDYYPYNSGTLLNVNPAGIKTVGFNAYDKATGKASLIGGNQYQITGTYTSLSYSTGEVLTPDSNGCFTATKTGELTVTGGGANTCVHLTWSGYRNGDYEDYWTRTRDINIQPYFPDGLKRTGAVYDEISKDKAVKRIGKVDLGTLDWAYSSTYRWFTNSSLADAKRPTNTSEPANAICSKYPIVPQHRNTTDLGVCLWGSGSYNISVLNTENYPDATAFKSAMSGVYLYYELAEPVETPIDPPLNLLYQVSDFGTEQFIGAGATEPKTLPVIADIVYGANYRDTIKNLPKNYAKVSGYYPDLYTGLADNLIDRKGNGTPQEISYRTSCGDDSIADDGNGIIQSIYGKTVVWNQLVDEHAFGSGTSKGITITNNNDGTVTLNGTATENYNVIITINNTHSSHKYYFGGCPVGGSLNSYYLGAYGVAVDIGNGGIYQHPSTFDFINYRIDVKSGVTVNNLVFKPRLIDLTQLFGSGNEPTSVDDPRIEWIKDYASAHPEYNSGELISYNGSGIKTVGFNQWDEVWEKSGISPTTGLNNNDTGRIRSKNHIPCMPNTVYNVVSSMTTDDIRFCYYDEDKEFISSSPWRYNGTFTTPSNAHYMRFYTGLVYGEVYKNDICINLSWSGYRNGEYEPYWSRTLALPISTYFPDGMKSAGSVRDEMTKDKAVKRIGKVDLGTLDWTNYKTGGFKTGNISDAIFHTTETSGAICAKYNRRASSVTLSSGEFSIAGRAIYIVDSAFTTDATAFKQAMSGVYLYYELATPIETTITPPLDLTYKVADFGTEESIAEGKSTPFNGIVKYSDDFTRGLVNMPKNYDTTASLDALATSLSTMLTSALDGTVTITRGAYDPATKKYAWSCTFTENQSN